MRKALARLTWVGLVGGAVFAVVRGRGGAGEVWHQANDIADGADGADGADRAVAAAPNDVAD